MATLQKYQATHDPAVESDYGRNWGEACDGTPGFLSAELEEVIQESIWEITADKERVPTLVISEQGTGISASKLITSVFVKGGTIGVAYKLTNQVKTLDKFGSKRTERKTGIVYCCRT